jgi:hypothetical protein
MNRKTYFLIAVSLMSLLVGVAIAHAQGPRPGGKRAPDPGEPSVTPFTYQGRLTNSSGAPLNSTVNVVFRLYDSSGTLLWTSATRSVTPVNGLFTVYLGDGSDPVLPGPTLYLAASIGVTVGGDPEMTPRQPLNTVVGHNNDSGAGVFGGSPSGNGVYGLSSSGNGMVGLSSSGGGVFGGSNTGNGVLGSTNNPATAGVFAFGAGASGTALSINNGGIQVSGAITDAITSATTPVFVHIVTAGNIIPSSTYATIITNTLTDARPTAILIVTPSFNYGNQGGGVNSSHPVGVGYDSGLSQWVIYNIDHTAMVAGQEFNVLVVTAP